MQNKSSEPNQKENNTSPLINWLTFLGLLLLIFYVFSLWYRWLKPDPEFLGFTSSVIEILAIVSFLGLQTDLGRRIAFQIDDTALFNYLFKTPVRFCIATWVAVLILALMFYVGSPIGSNFFRTKGVEALEEGNYSRAIKMFNQAISLDPENARSHYNLAVAYEALYEYDAAILEYQISLEFNNSFWPTYNNLGRLLMVNKNDTQAAISILTNGSRIADNPIGKAVINKNLARAYLEYGLFQTALELLEDNIYDLTELRSQGQTTEIYLAESYHLQARIYQEIGEGEQAKLSWQDSLGFALSVAESLDCTNNQGSLPQFCIDAIQMREEAQENLNH